MGTSTRHLSFAMFRAALRRASTHATSATQKTGGIYEVRTYDIEPSRLDEYLAMCADSANERKKVTNEGFVGFFVTELGGDAHEVTHVYRYDDYDARDDARNAMKRSETWTAFLKASKPMVRRQKSEIFLEATKATASAGVAAVSARVGIQPDPEARRRVSQGTAVEISERSRRARGVGVDGIQRRGEIEPIRRAVAIRLLSGSHKGARSRAVRRCVAR